MIRLCGACDVAVGEFDPASPYYARRSYRLSQRNHGRPAGVRPKSQRRTLFQHGNAWIMFLLKEFMRFSMEPYS